jgi:hypothetical protein
MDVAFGSGNPSNFTTPWCHHTNVSELAQRTYEYVDACCKLVWCGWFAVICVGGSFIFHGQNAMIVPFWN